MGNEGNNGNQMNENAEDPGQAQQYGDYSAAPRCRPRTSEGDCPALSSYGKEACLSAVDNRPWSWAKGQPCVWCIKDCENKHLCELKSAAQPPDTRYYQECLSSTQTTADLMKVDKMADEREQEMENQEEESGAGGTRSMIAGGGQANDQGGDMLPADVTWKIIEMMKRAAKFRQESESIFLQVGRDLASHGFTGHYQPEIHQNLGSGSGGNLINVDKIENKREEEYLEKTGEKLKNFLGGNDHKWVKHTQKSSKPSKPTSHRK